MEDQISNLPDEILVFVLSFLTIREATITSLVSRRWRNLWKSIIRLKFDVVNKWGPHGYVRKPLRWIQFVQWVDQVLNLYQSSSIDEFRVCFDLQKTAACHIDHWISFAIARNVKWLELNFSINGHYQASLMRYPLPSLFAEEMVTSVEYMALMSCSLSSPGIGCFKSLTSLLLKDVDLSDEVFECFLSNCVLLEHLSVEGANNLVNAEVIGSSLQLKCLEIYFCDRLKSIKIYATNLISFKYFGPRVCLSLNSTPRLVEVYFGVVYQTCKDRMSYVCSQLSDNVFRLETILLELIPCEVALKSMSLPTFFNLKVLVLWVCPRGESFIGFTPLLKASPFLHRFELHLVRRFPQLEPGEVHTTSGCPHHYLEEVELGGFRGHTSDIELLMYLVENAISLKKITLDPHDKYLSESKWIFTENDEMQTARERGLQLRHRLPSRVDLVIL